ncbi:hypothetical protein HU200_006479 [Digitaria exilis]|uniref:Replication factor-A protein 1 N-terminal domain-containing protein n=1 Tax=Digitaria exilis TaxID=1010633 RepID=A0A835FRY4_9POAL|nr:hypothetical protein HU200_006479 [Digitaria exilis]
MLQQPVLQVVSVARSRQEILEEFQLVLSDGVHTRNATLASHLNHLVKNSHLQMGTVICLLEFTCSTVQSHSVVQLEVLQTECELIGRPKAYEPCCIGKPCWLQTRRSELYHGLVPISTQQENASHSSDQASKRLLTEGTVVAILEGKMVVEQKPVMQVVHVSLVLLIKCDRIGSPKFHPLGLKHEELYANPAANIPWLPVKNPTDPRVLSLLEELAKSSFRSYPGYNSRPG